LLSVVQRQEADQREFQRNTPAAGGGQQSSVFSYTEWIRMVALVPEQALSLVKSLKPTTNAGRKQQTFRRPTNVEFMLPYPDACQSTSIL
jgi:hypothetical protein